MLHTFITMNGSKTFRETITVSCQNHAKYINNVWLCVCGKQCLNVPAGGEVKVTAEHTLGARGTHPFILNFRH
jgi:hypothetical protein